MRVFVTGVTGFIGAHLRRHLLQNGFQVRGAARSLPSGPGDCIALSLGQEPDVQAFEGVDAVVHCAWSMDAGAAQSNIDGTLKIMTAARDAGVPHQLFVSSYSAHQSATSEYGKNKLAVERAFLDRCMAVARPGLVIGEGGIYLRMVSMLGRLPVVPLLRTPGALPVIGIEDLVRAIAAWLRSPGPGSYELYLPDLVTLRELIGRIADHVASGKPRVAAPVRPVLFALRTLEALGVPLPVRSGSLEGFLASQARVPESGLAALIETVTPLDELLPARSR